MPIALDASLWDEPTTGIGLYSSELFHSLKRLHLDVERWGAAHSGERPRETMSRTAWTLSQLPHLLQRQKPALYHAVSNFNLPLVKPQNVPLVLTVHDLVPILLPETVSAAFRWQFRIWLSRSLKVADQIICVSETARQSLVENFDVDDAKLSVVLHGVDHLDAVAPPDETTVTWLETLGLAEPWILYAGALDARKNVQVLLRALEILRARGQKPTLVLAGQKWFGSRAVEHEVVRLRRQGVDIRMLGYLSATPFYALMRRASIFVFPSRYEGFGLPPLEAMYLGVPSIVSTGGSLTEVCGPGAEMFDPNNAEMLSFKLRILLTSSEQRQALSARGRRWAENFRWANTAAQTVEVYRRVATF